MTHPGPPDVNGMAFRTAAAAAAGVAIAVNQAFGPVAGG